MNLSPLKIVPFGFFRGLFTRYCKARFLGLHPTFLLLHLTDRCNCRCTMCHIWKKKEITDIPLSEYKRIFRDPLWKKLRILSLTGGEPFLRTDLKDVVQLAIESFPHLERISLPSNGLLTRRIVETTREIMEILPGRIYFKIGISLDGPGEVHDAMRGVPGAFQKAVQTIRELQKIPHPNFGVGILALFAPENIPALRETDKIFDSLTDQISWTLISQSEFFGNLEEENEIYSSREKEEILGFIRGELIPRFPEKAYLYHKYRDHLLKKRRTYPCLAGYRSSYIDGQGNLLPCHYLGKEFAFTNVLEEKGGLERAWFSKEARELRKRMEKNPYCRNCSNNCDSRNLIQEDFWNFFSYLLTHPLIPVRALFKKKKKGVK